MGFVLCMLFTFNLFGFYVWYMCWHLPAKLEKMTPEEREKFIRDWRDSDVEHF